jgi:predicted DNA binding protein
MIFKKYDEREYVEVDFQMRHEKCWTEITDGLNVNIHTVSSNVHKDNNYIYGTVEIKAESEREFKKFLTLFKQSCAISEILRISTSAYRKNLYEVSFKEKYSNMIVSLLYENDVVYHNDLISDNFEYIMAIVPVETVKNLKSSLSELGDMPYFHMKSDKQNGKIDSVFNLTDQEAFTVYMAYQNGYFNIPREKYLSELAEITGLSKSALEEYMRKATGKIMDEWTRKNRYFLMKKFGE